MDLPSRGLLPEDLAALYTGRPASTIRRWAAEGRIQRYGSGRGKVRYSVYELPGKTVDDWTGVTTLGPRHRCPPGRKQLDPTDGYAVGSRSWRPMLASTGSNPERRRYLKAQA